jgi:hypothetical protein
MRISYEHRRDVDDEATQVPPVEAMAVLAVVARQGGGCVMAASPTLTAFWQTPHGV